MSEPLQVLRKPLLLPAENCSLAERSGFAEPQRQQAHFLPKKNSKSRPGSSVWPVKGLIRLDRTVSEFSSQKLDAIRKLRRKQNQGAQFAMMAFMLMAAGMLVLFIATLPLLIQAPRMLAALVDDAISSVKQFSRGPTPAPFPPCFFG